MTEHLGTSSRVTATDSLDIDGRIFSFSQIRMNFTSNDGLTSDGVDFTVNLAPNLVLNDNFAYVVTPVTAEIPYTTPNISEKLNNNRFLFSVSGTPYTIIIANGLYGTDTLTHAINTALYDDNLITDPVTDPAFIITGLNSSQQTQVNITKLNWAFTIPASGGLAQILGFDAGTYGSTPPISPHIYTSQNQANFGTLFSYVIHCSIVSGSYQSKGGIAIAGDVLASIPITVNPGGLINYAPSFQTPSPLSNTNINQIRFFLTDQSNNIISDLQGQPWSINIMIDRAKNLI